MQPNSNSDLNMDPSSPRNSREIIDKDVVGNMGNMEPPIHQRTPDRDRQDMYRYTRSPAKQGMPTKQHIETKTDYGKYRLVVLFFFNVDIRKQHIRIFMKIFISIFISKNVS